MEKIMKKIQPKHYGIIAALLSMLGMYMILSYSQLLSTGKFIVMDADLLEQYVPFIKMFVRDILEGESIWYSWSTSMGMNTSMLNAYYVLSPFNILYFIFYNVDETIITAAIIILKIGLSAYTFHIFLYRVVKCQDAKSIIFSVMYALSTFSVTYGWLYNSWMEAVYMLPLICTFIYEADNHAKSYLKLILAYAYMFCTQFYFAYMVGIFSFVFWLILLFARKNTSVKLLFKKILCYLGSVLLAVGLAMIVVWPAFLFLITKNVEDASGFSEWTTNVMDVYHAMFAGTRMPANNDWPALYCGWLMLILVPLYFINREIHLKEKIYAGVLCAVILLTMLVSPLYQFMHAFDAPDGYCFRHAFLLMFLLCALAARQSAYIEKVKSVHLYAIAGIHVVAYIIMEQVIGDEYNLPWLRIVSNIVIPIIWLGIWYFVSKKPGDKRTAMILSVIVLMVELCFNGWFCIYTPDMKQQSHYECWKEGITGATEELSKDDTFYRAYYNVDYVTNSDSWFGYNGINDFCSSENYNLRTAMKELGLYTTMRRTEFFGITQPVEMLLGVKYIMQGPYPYSEYGNDNIYYIEENPYYLQLGYMVDEDVITYQGENMNSFENINSLMSALCGREIRCFEPVKETVLIECDQADIYTDEYGTIVKYDSLNSDYGMITYYLPKESVDKATYIQFLNEYSVAQDLSPYLGGGMENIVRQNGLLSVSYIKPLLEGEDRYSASIVMNKTTADEWGYKDVAVYEYNEQALQEAYEDLSRHQMFVEEYKDDYVRGTVTVGEDKNILFTSIPYDEGWSVYVDGVQVHPFAVVQDAFMAFELEPGVHEIELKYEAPGVKEGLLISGVSAGIYLMVVFLYLYRRKREKNKVSGQN